MNKIRITTLLFFLITCLNSFAQQKVSTPNLLNENKFQTINRNISLTTNKQGKVVIHLNAKPNDGVAWIKDLNFETGIIEFDAKGKDVLQESFVGIAFHDVNDSTYEVVYFRPFNFQAIDSNRKKHSVQYISLPKFDWSFLRDTYPDKYEHALLNSVDPNSWFHVKIIIDKNRIQAFINSDVQACLSVIPLTHNQSGKLGFWVGNNSDGDFSNLILTTN